MRKGFRPDPFFERDEPARQQEARRFVGLAQEFPWVLFGHCDLDRRYDFLIYLLEVGEQNGLFPAGMSRAAVLGTRQVADSACAGQGFPINWTSPEEAAALERHLKAIDQHELARQFSLAEVPSDRVLYKRYQYWDAVSPEGRKQLVNTLFHDLRNLTLLYTAARQNGFGVIVVRD
jgi:hypothetical protein